MPVCEERRLVCMLASVMVPVTAVTAVRVQASAQLRAGHQGERRDRAPTDGWPRGCPGQREGVRAAGQCEGVRAAGQREGVRAGSGSGSRIQVWVGCSGCVRDSVVGDGQEIFLHTCWRTR